MIFCLRDKDLGYVKGEKEFSNIKDWKNYKEARYFLNDVAMGDQFEGAQYARENFKLLKAFNNKNAWGTIYENTHFQEQAITSKRQNVNLTF
jgi:hypothetical protein